MSDIHIKVLLHADHIARIDDVGAALAHEGLRIAETIPQIGLILGDVDETRLDGLRAVDGVMTAEPEGGMRLPPMDDDIPQ